MVAACVVINGPAREMARKLTIIYLIDSTVQAISMVMRMLFHADRVSGRNIACQTKQCFSKEPKGRAVGKKLMQGNRR